MRLKKFEKSHFQNFTMRLSIQPLITAHNKSEWQHCLLVNLPIPQMLGLREILLGGDFTWKGCLTVKN